MEEVLRLQAEVVAAEESAVCNNVLTTSSKGSICL
jgi:hypothetical protein